MNNIIAKLKDKRIAILGFGKEGYSTYKYIRKHLSNQKLTILDKINILDNYSEFKTDNNLDFVLGDNYLSDLLSYDYIIKTPGVSLTQDLIISLKDKLTSQMDLVLNETDAFIIGITGTKGKSTTSSLIYKVLKDQNKDVYLVGNIGNPILDYIDLINQDTILVAEYSAHQLQFIKKSPHIGIILNLFEEHLDYFGELTNYYEAKLNMFKYQTSSDYALYFRDNETLATFINKNNYKSNLIPITFNATKEDCFYSDNEYIYKKSNGEYIKLYNLSDKRNLVGEHNISNIMFVFAITDILNLNKDKCIESINTFEPLNHRLQKVGTYKDIIFYSDTIATIPEATINGINSLKFVDTLIFGGMDRGIDYSDFAKKLLNTSVSNFICMPDTGYKVGKELEKLLNNKKIYYTEELDEAVNIAYQVTKKDKICLLSPAAPSYNKYKNYDEKGNKYIEFIKNHSEK